MTLYAWRIVKAKHAATAFTGDGAKKYGGRWNSPGTAVIYVADRLSLAMLEMLVHFQSQELLDRYVSFRVAFDRKLVTTVDPKTLPRSWRKSPPPAEIQQIGDDWLADAKSAILRVPSVVVPDEWNYLLNPAHPEYRKITVGSKKPVRFDPRLIRTT